MKKIFTILLCASALFVHAQTSLSGKISDGDTGEELISANISLFKGGVFITGATTDFDGNYRLELDPGTYDVAASYVGYAASQITGVVVRAGQDNKLHVKLSTGVNLEEICVVDYKIPLIEQDNCTQGSIITSNDIRRSARNNTTSSAVYIDGIRLKNNKRTRSKQNKISKSNNSTTSTTTTPNHQANPLPSAGQLTAGEWKDLNNWTFWDELMKNTAFSQYQSYWGFYPDYRFEIKLSDSNGKPVANTTVHLLNVAEEIVWSSRSDNKGSACLWGNFYGGDNEAFQLQIITADGEKKIPAIPYTQGLNNVQLTVPCAYSNKVDIAFVVDVSGSMFDEINYLKIELSDVIGQINQEDETLQIRTGAVYYSGSHEPQLLNNSPLTAKHEETINFIKTSPTGGGGNEAVNLGLGMAIRDFDWNQEAIARIVFILLDEPPAYTENIKKDMQLMIQEAAKKGIKVIPVAASGTNKPTEFLLKFFAMGTNSTYTFLTNHSGIGNDHAAPEAGDYNVETLNDLMVRLILESSEYATCEEEHTPIVQIVKKNKTHQKTITNKPNNTFAKQISCAPNPATDYINITLEKAIDLLIITSSDGQIISQYPKVEAGEIRLQTSSWGAGIYFFHFQGGEESEVKKVVVERS